MSKGTDLARLRVALMATAILAAPFIALLFRIEAGLVVMATALSAGSFLLSDALGATPDRLHRLLQLAIWVNLAVAAACMAVAAWLLVR